MVRGKEARRVFVICFPSLHTDWIWCVFCAVLVVVMLLFLLMRLFTDFFFVIFRKIMKTVKPNGCGPWPSMAINSFCSWGLWSTTESYYNCSLVPYILYATREQFKHWDLPKPADFICFFKKKSLKCVLSVLLNRGISQFSNLSLFLPLILYTGLRWYGKQFHFSRGIPFSVVFSPSVFFSGNCKLRTSIPILYPLLYSSSPQGVAAFWNVLISVFRKHSVVSPHRFLGCNLIHIFKELVI